MTQGTPLTSPTAYDTLEKTVEGESAMARGVRRIVLVLLAAALLAFAAWMLWPRSLGEAFAFDQPFTLTVTELETQEDGSWTVKEPVSSVLEPGTPAAEAVQEALEEYFYHLCLSSLTGDRLGPIGEKCVFLDSVSDGKKDHLGLIAGSNKLGCGDRVVQGYFRDSAVLCQKLSAILRSESGVAN